MKHTAASILGLACAASILSSSAAGAITLRPLDTTPVPAAFTAYTEVPAWADSYVDSIAVDSTVALHKYPPLVYHNLEWSGIRHLRDSGPAYALLVAQYAELGRHGIKHTIGLLQGFDPAELKLRLDAFAPYVDYVEAANEADNVAVPNWAQMKLDQQNIWNVIHSNPAYANVAVMGPSFANPLNAQYVMPLDPVQDFAQLHNATCDWNPGVTNNAGIVANTVKIRLGSNKPIVTTETGYNSDLTRGCSLPNDIIAKYVPRTSAERWIAGEPRTYFDFLTDNPDSVAFGGLGLLNVDGTMKPQMIATAGVIHIVADPGVAPAPQVVSYGISGATPDVHHIMLARKDGYDLMVWRELPSWVHQTRSRIPVAPLPISVTIPANTKWVGLFQTDTNFAYHRVNLPVSSAHVTTTFNVTDSISILHIYGLSSSASSVRR